MQTKVASLIICGENTLSTGVILNTWKSILLVFCSGRKLSRIEVTQMKNSKTARKPFPNLDTRKGVNRMKTLYSFKDKESFHAVPVTKKIGENVIKSLGVI